MAEENAETVVAEVLAQHRVSYDHRRAGWSWWCTCPTFTAMPRPAPQQLFSEAHALGVAHVAHEVVAALVGAGLFGKTRWGIQIVGDLHVYEFTSEVDARNQMAWFTDRVLLVRRDATEWREVADGG